MTAFSDWRVEPLSKCVTIVGDKVEPSDAGDLPYIGLEHIQKDTGVLLGIGSPADVKSTKTRFQAGDVLYGKLRPYLNKVLVAPTEGVCSTDILALRGRDGVSAKYVYYRLRSSDFVAYASSNSKGVNLPRVSPKAVGEFPVALPSLDEQERIVARIEELMSDVDAGLSDLEAGLMHCSTAEAATLNHGVLGGAAGVDERGRPGLQPGWKWMQMKDACSVIQDGSHFSPQTRFDEPGPGRYRYITSKNVRPWGLDLDDMEYVDEEFHQSIWARCQPSQGDVLLVKDGVKTGTVAINSLAEPFSLLSSVALLKPKDGVLNSRYLKYYLQAPYGFRMVTGSMTGTAIKRIILAKIRSSWVPIPPLDEQVAIAVAISERLSLVEASRTAAVDARNQCVGLRQSILKSAFSGQLVQ